MSILEVNGLKKVYTTRLGGNKVAALKNVNYSVSVGENVASVSRISSFSILSRSKIISTFRASSRARATMRCIPASNR